MQRDEVDVVVNVGLVDYLRFKMRLVTARQLYVKHFMLQKRRKLAGMTSTMVAPELMSPPSSTVGPSAIGAGMRGAAGEDADFGNVSEIAVSIALDSNSLSLSSKNKVFWTNIAALTTVSVLILLALTLLQQAFTLDRITQRSRNQGTIVASFIDGFMDVAVAQRQADNADAALTLASQLQHVAALQMLQHAVEAGHSVDRSAIMLEAVARRSLDSVNQSMVGVLHILASQQATKLALAANPTASPVTTTAVAPAAAQAAASASSSASLRVTDVIAVMRRYRDLMSTGANVSTRFVPQYAVFRVLGTDLHLVESTMQFQPLNSSQGTSSVSTSSLVGPATMGFGQSACVGLVAGWVLEQSADLAQGAETDASRASIASLRAMSSAALAADSVARNPLSPRRFGAPLNRWQPTQQILDVVLASSGPQMASQLRDSVVISAPFVDQGAPLVAPRNEGDPSFNGRYRRILQDVSFVGGVAGNDTSGDVVDDAQTWTHFAARSGGGASYDTLETSSNYAVAGWFKPSGVAVCLSVPLLEMAALEAAALVETANRLSDASTSDERPSSRRTTWIAQVRVPRWAVPPPTAGGDFATVAVDASRLIADRNISAARSTSSSWSQCFRLLHVAGGGRAGRSVPPSSDLAWTTMNPLPQWLRCNGTCGERSRLRAASGTYIGCPVGELLLSSDGANRRTVNATKATSSVAVDDELQRSCVSGNFSLNLLRDAALLAVGRQRPPTPPKATRNGVVPAMLQADPMGTPAAVGAQWIPRPAHRWLLSNAGGAAKAFAAWWGSPAVVNDCVVAYIAVETRSAYSIVEGLLSTTQEAIIAANSALKFAAVRRQNGTRKAATDANASDWLRETNRDATSVSLLHRRWSRRSVSEAERDAEDPRTGYVRGPWQAAIVPAHSRCLTYWDSAPSFWQTEGNATASIASRGRTYFNARVSAAEAAGSPVVILGTPTMTPREKTSWPSATSAASVFSSSCDDPPQLSTTALPLAPARNDCGASDSVDDSLPADGTSRGQDLRMTTSCAQQFCTRVAVNGLSTVLDLNADVSKAPFVLGFDGRLQVTGTATFRYKLHFKSFADGALVALVSSSDIAPEFKQWQTRLAPLVSALAFPPPNRPSSTTVAAALRPSSTSTLNAWLLSDEWRELSCPDAAGDTVTGGLLNPEVALPELSLIVQSLLTHTSELIGAEADGSLLQHAARSTLSSSTPQAADSSAPTVRFVTRMPSGDGAAVAADTGSHVMLHTFDERRPCGAGVTCVVEAPPQLEAAYPRLDRQPVALRGLPVLYRSDCPICAPFNDGDPAFLTRFAGSRVTGSGLEPTSELAKFVARFSTDRTAAYYFDDAAAASRSGGAPTAASLSHVTQPSTWADDRYLGSVTRTSTFHGVVVVAEEKVAMLQQLSLQRIVIPLVATIPFFLLAVVVLRITAVRIASQADTEWQEHVALSQRERTFIDALVQSAMPGFISAKLDTEALTVGATASNVAQPSHRVSLADSVTSIVAGVLDIPRFGDASTQWTPLEVTQFVAYYRLLGEEVARRCGVTVLRSFADTMIVVSGASSTKAPSCVNVASFCCIIMQLVGPQYQHNPHLLPELRTLFSVSDSKAASGGSLAGSRRDDNGAGSPAGGLDASAASGAGGAASSRVARNQESEETLVHLERNLWRGARNGDDDDDDDEDDQRHNDYDRDDAGSATDAASAMTATMSDISSTVSGSAAGSRASARRTENQQSMLLAKAPPTTRGRRTFQGLVPKAGIHMGPGVVSAVQLPRGTPWWDVFSPIFGLAFRLQATAKIGTIHVSSQVKDVIMAEPECQFAFSEPQRTALKSGAAMTSYLVETSFVPIAEDLLLDCCIQHISPDYLFRSEAADREAKRQRRSSRSNSASERSSHMSDSSRSSNSSAQSDKKMEKRSSSGAIPSRESFRVRPPSSGQLTEQK